MFHVLFLLILVPWLVGDGRGTAENEDPQRGPAVRDDETAEARLYRLAAARGGTLTVSDVVVAMGIPVREAQSLLEGMVDERYVRMSVTERGAPLFEFPELMPGSVTHRERS